MHILDRIKEIILNCNIDRRNSQTISEGQRDVKYERHMKADISELKKNGKHRERKDTGW